MKRIPMADWLAFGGIPLVVLAAAIWAFLTPQEWTAPKLIVIISATLAFMGIGATILLLKMLEKPTYVTKQGVCVWNCVNGPHRIEVELALEVFLLLLPIPGTADMLRNARVEFSSKLVSSIGIGWYVKDKAGLQRGNTMLIRWTGSITTCPFFHELLHMYDELVLSRGVRNWIPDYKHENHDIWVHEGELNAAYKRRVA